MPGVLDRRFASSSPPPLCASAWAYADRPPTLAGMVRRCNFVAGARRLGVLGLHLRRPNDIVLAVPCIGGWVFNKVRNETKGCEGCALRIRLHWSHGDARRRLDFASLVCTRGGGSNPGPQSQESRGLVQATAGQVHLGTRNPCRSHAIASRAYLLRSYIKLLSSSSSSRPRAPRLSGAPKIFFFPGT
jgi:hypothetical protein